MAGEELLFIVNPDKITDEIFKSFHSLFFCCPAACTNSQKRRRGVKMNASEVNSFTVFSITETPSLLKQRENFNSFLTSCDKLIHELVHTLTRPCQLLYRLFVLGFPATCWLLGVSAFGGFATVQYLWISSHAWFCVAGRLGFG